MLEKVSDPASVCIAVITSYPKWYQGPLRSIKHTDKIRGDLALETLQAARENGYQIVCVNGLSAKTFTKEVEQIEGVHCIKRRTMKRAPGRRHAIKVAAKLAGVEIIVLTDPEKVSLLDSLPEMVAPIVSGKAEIVIPRRQERLFKLTYPEYMYHSEREGNKIFNEALRSQNLLTKELEDLDSFFGPRVLRNTPPIVALFMQQFTYKIGGTFFPTSYFDPEQYSNVLFFPIVRALEKKKKVLSVEIPFSYPSLQKENETFGEQEIFIVKRNMQRLGILVNLLHFLSYLKKC